MALKISRFYERGREALALELVTGEKGLKRTLEEASINRPGLALAGFFKYFAWRRVQVFGLAEQTFLKNLRPAERAERLRRFFEARIPCLVLTRGMRPTPEVVKLADEYKVPVFRSPLITSQFVNAGTVVLEELTAPILRAQGTMLDIKGMGVLMEGQPGIGKSEIALALLERGHSLVSDDVTILQRSSTGAIVGSPAEITRYHMEIKGVGIVHVPSLFGIAAIRLKKQLDLIVTLLPAGATADRMEGDEPLTRAVLGTQIPCIHLVVAPGRDMSHAVHLAALNQKLRLLGHDAVKELDQRILDLFCSRRVGGE